MAKFAMDTGAGAGEGGMAAEGSRCGGVKEGEALLKEDEAPWSVAVHKFTGGDSLGTECTVLGREMRL
jgi:hypothetical protein